MSVNSTLFEVPKYYGTNTQNNTGTTNAINNASPSLFTGQTQQQQVVQQQVATPNSAAAAEMKAQLNETRGKQGIIGGAWDGIKNFFGIGAGSNKAEKAIEKFEKGELSYEEAQKALGKYENGQKVVVDTVAGVASGLVAVAAIAAAPFTGGASLLLGAAVGGAVNVGVKGIDSAIGGREYTFKDGLGDFAMGAVNGALAGVTAGVGTAAKQAIAPAFNAAVKEGGKQIVFNTAKSAGTQVAQRVAISAVGGAATGTIYGAGMSAANYIIKEEGDKSIGGFLGATVSGATTGAVTGAALGAAGESIKIGGEKINAMKGNNQAKAGMFSDEAITKRVEGAEKELATKPDPTKADVREYEKIAKEAKKELGKIEKLTKDTDVASKENLKKSLESFEKNSNEVGKDLNSKARETLENVADPSKKQIQEYNKLSKDALDGAKKELKNLEKLAEKTPEQTQRISDLKGEIEKLKNATLQDKAGKLETQRDKLVTEMNSPYDINESTLRELNDQLVEVNKQIAEVSPTLKQRIDNTVNTVKEVPGKVFDGSSTGGKIDKGLNLLKNNKYVSKATEFIGNTKANYELKPELTKQDYFTNAAIIGETSKDVKEASLAREAISKAKTQPLFTTPYTQTTVQQPSGYSYDTSQIQVPTYGDLNGLQNNLNDMNVNNFLLANGQYPQYYA